MTSDHTVKRLMVAILVFLVLNFAANAGTLMQQGNRDETIDHMDETIEDVDNTVADVQDQSENVSDYVDDLRNPSDDARARNAAVTEAVRQVPAIKDILCDPTAFPEAAACQEGS